MRRPCHDETPVGCPQGLVNLASLKEVYINQTRTFNDGKCPVTSPVSTSNVQSKCVSARIKGNFHTVSTKMKMEKMVLSHCRKDSVSQTNQIWEQTGNG